MTVNAAAFDFSLSNDGNKPVTPGQSIASTITATLSSGSSQAVRNIDVLCSNLFPYVKHRDCYLDAYGNLHDHCNRHRRWRYENDKFYFDRKFSHTESLIITSFCQYYLTNIADGAVLSGSAVVWTATPSGSPIRVEFSIDGTLLWTENTSPHQFNGDPSGTLNTNVLSNGSHQLKVRAIYSDTSTAEQAVTVTVSNGTAPTPLQLSLAWQDSSNNDDNFAVERKTGTSGSIFADYFDGNEHHVLR